MQEKRISVRTGLLGVEIKISKDGTRWTTVATKDISDGGLSFVSRKEFDLGTKLNLKGEASDFTKTIDISCNIEIVFCGKTPEGESLYGVKFLDMDNDRHTRLSIFIEKMVTKYPPLLVL